MLLNIITIEKKQKTDNNIVNLFYRSIEVSRVKSIVIKPAC